MAKEIEKQQPTIEKQIKDLEPVLRDCQQKAELISRQVEENFVIPVAIKENDAARQIIIKEEGSGAASVKVYYLSFENGQWILQPEWMFTAKKVSPDSLLKKTDTSCETIKRILPQQ